MLNLALALRHEPTPTPERGLGLEVEFHIPLVERERVLHALPGVSNLAAYLVDHGAASGYRLFRAIQHSGKLEHRDPQE